MNRNLHNVADLERITRLEDDLRGEQAAAIALAAKLQHRIAELEAELAEWKTAKIAPAKDLRIRAEKAEAEVERLRADCRAHTRNHRVPGHTHPEPCCLADYSGFHCGVNPSGDTLGERDDG